MATLLINFATVKVWLKNWKNNMGSSMG